MSGARAFRLVAIVEAVSWLLLIVATVVKYTQGNQVAVHVLGPVHGVLFLVYVVLALFPARRELRWNRATTAWVLVESVLPGGGFVAARSSGSSQRRGASSR